MTAKKLASGATAYYWAPSSKDIREGCKLQREALGGDYAAATDRAGDLNQSLDDWRIGKNGVPASAAARHGTVGWWLAQYRRHTAFTKLSPRSQPEYLRHLRIVETVELKNGQQFCELNLSQITPLAADRLYQRLAEGRLRQANFEVDIMKKAWRSIQRLHPAEFPKGNPWEGIERITAPRQTKIPALMEEVYALADALMEAGHPGLAAAAVIAFEWLQRPENILDGAVKWTNYRPGQKVKIEHWKTGAEFWLELSDREGALYAEIEALLQRVPRLGVPIVLRPDGQLYKRRHAHAVVRKARIAAGLPDHITLAACRHGGMTELGDAELTEQGVMALSGHSTPQAARMYVKRTKTQQLIGARKRRNHRFGEAKSG